MTIRDLRLVLQWTGDEGVAIGEALKQMSEATAHGVEADRLRLELDANIRAWLDGRQAAISDAFQGAFAKNKAAGPPVAHAAGQKAGTEAAERYERTTPRPTTPAGSPAVPLMYVTEDEVGEAKGVVARVRELVS